MDVHGPAIDMSHLITSKLLQRLGMREAAQAVPGLLSSISQNQEFYGNSGNASTSSTMPAKKTRIVGCAHFQYLRQSRQICRYCRKDRKPTIPTFSGDTGSAGIEEAMPELPGLSKISWFWICMLLSGKSQSSSRIWPFVPQSEAQWIEFNILNAWIFVPSLLVQPVILDSYSRITPTRKERVYFP